MNPTIIEQILLGIIQGITEWIPISSSAMITFFMVNFLKITNPEIIIRSALFLHLGTFLAALIYFRKDVADLIKALFNYKISPRETQATLKFIIITTLISGILGFFLLFFFYNYISELKLTGKTITFFVGVLLLFTGILQIKIKDRGIKKASELKNKDSVILGFTQAIATLPGVSRSGITISTLLLRKFNDTTALKLSFIMSLPIVLVGNIILSLEDVTLYSTSIYALLTSFIFGLLTIHGLIRLSKKINFGWFAILFAVLMLISILI
ncbi:undecaprenyl-diphosphate phosphatase [Nanoarchaeota archaeon]